MPQNDSEWPISLDLQLFQSFPTEVTQNDSEWPIFLDLQLFQSFPIEVAQNDSEWPILPNLQLFPPKWLRMTQKSQFYIVHAPYSCFFGCACCWVLGCVIAFNCVGEYCESIPWNRTGSYVLSL